MALSHLEEQLVWLTKKIRRDKSFVVRAEAFYDDKQHDWPRGVLNLFLITIEKMKDQLYYEEHRLEEIAWQVVEAREGRSIDTYGRH